jgi:hypothetical protein
MSPTFAACTFALNRTGIAYFSFRFVNENLPGGSSRYAGKDLSLRTDVVIFLRVVPKEFGGVVLRALAKICGRKVGSDPAFFQTHDIRHGAIFALFFSPFSPIGGCVNFFAIYL